MSNEIGEAINLLSSANNLHYELWMFYIVGAIGLLGFRFSDTYVKLEKKQRLFIVLGFIAFAVSNSIAMYQNLDHLDSVLFFLQSDKAIDVSSGFKEVFNQYNHKSKFLILGFHVLSTVVISSLLYLPDQRSN